ncbi:MAG: transglutaminase domain-containing protein [Lachnospiraceae bacterium]|nr:transglutaminase domain-containing protein [Lachnospiraceae bacterium]
MKKRRRFRLLPILLAVFLLQGCGAHKPGGGAVSVTPENTAVPTAKPTQQEPVYHTENYESGYNPEIVTAYLSKNRELLTDPLDLELYDLCAVILAEILGDRELTLPEAEKAIYEYVAGYVKYDPGYYSLEGVKPDSCNAYGALVNGIAICTGYSSSFRLLCSMAGIECIEVTGQAHYERNAHGWNMVKIGPYWYHVDPCWGWDGKKEVYFDYFNETSAFFEETEHYWEKSDYPPSDTVNYETRAKMGYLGDVGPFDDPEVPKRRIP